MGGFFTSYNGITGNYIARLHSNGSFDTGFNIGGTGANNDIRNILIQSDGKILIGGTFTGYNGISANRVARLNSNGSLDTGFNVGGTGANNQIITLSLQTDGKILIGGVFTGYNGVSANKFARLNSNGSLDTGFVTTVGASSTVNTITLQPDGKILIGGAFTGYNSVVTNYIARVTTNFNPSILTPTTGQYFYNTGNVTVTGNGIP